MHLKQKILRLFYPALIAFQGLRGKKQLIINTQHAIPPIPFHSLSVRTINGKTLDFKDLQGKKVLIVNTASNCGYTGQYAELQALFDRSAGKLAIIGFPANDFKEQEPGADEEISQFCSVNYGVQFPLASKSQVVKGPRQHPVYQWLTRKEDNGWNDQPPTWNFSKYLIDEQGTLTHYFDPSISPLGPEFTEAMR